MGRRRVREAIESGAWRRIVAQDWVGCQMGGGGSACNARVMGVLRGEASGSRTCIVVIVGSSIADTTERTITIGVVTVMWRASSPGTSTR